jgi:hypothetical protein
LRAEKIDAVLPALGTLVGAGTVDAKNSLDFKMAATLTGGAIGAIGNSGSAVGGVLGQLTGGGAGGAKGCKGGGTTVPFQIQGTTADPKFIPDVGGLAAGLFKSELGCAGGALAGAAKPGTTGNPASNPADAVNAIGGLFGKKKKP